MVKIRKMKEKILLFYLKWFTLTSMIDLLLKMCSQILVIVHSVEKNHLRGLLSARLAMTHLMLSMYGTLIDSWT